MIKQLSRHLCILAGGRGSRVSHRLPANLNKCALIWNNKPLIHHIISGYAEIGFKRVTILSGINSGSVRSAVKRFQDDHRSLGIDFCHSDVELGTGGAVLKAIVELQINSDLYVTNGDTVLKFFNIGNFFEVMEAKKNANAVICVKPGNPTHEQGFVNYEDSGEIISLTRGELPKKVKNTGISAGLLRINSTYFREFVIDNLAKKTNFSLEGDVLSSQHYYPKYVCPIVSEFIDFGTKSTLPQEYLA